MSEPLRKVVRVRCSVAHAFATFAERIDLWWPPSHRKLEQSKLQIEGREGGRFFERDDAGREVDLGEVLQWAPPREFAYTWYLGVETGATEVRVRFTPVGEHTEVEVLHAEGSSALGEEWPARVQRFERAWQQVLPIYIELAEQASA